jgi:hypothetical protein
MKHLFKAGDVVQVKPQHADSWRLLWGSDPARVVIASRVRRMNSSGFPCYKIRDGVSRSAHKYSNSEAGENWFVPPRTR